MIRFRPPQARDLQAPLQTEESASVTYVQKGATRGNLPAGFKHDEVSMPLGHGRALFEACGQHLDDWGLQRSMGFAVFPDETQVLDATTILLSLPIFRLTFIASCRVIYTVRDDTRHGFAYGTLPMHPECGEEYFGVRIDDGGEVHFELRAFSRPRAFFARIGGPITRQLQLKALRQYGKEMRAFAERFEGGAHQASN